MPLLTPTTAKNRQGRTVAIPVTKMAPVKGWNAVDPTSAIPEGEALVLDNWFPRDSFLETRKGSQLHATGASGDVLTVMPYTALAGKLFACTNTAILDVTSPGAAIPTGQVLTNGQMQHINFSTQAGTFLVGVNGSDDMQLFNGTSWQAVNATSTPIAITGLATNTFIGVNNYKRRLFFVLKGKLSFAYLLPATLGGAATEFPLEGIFTKGGYLVAMGTWTLDAGRGSDDHAVFVTSEGEAAVYSGSDPGDATDWKLVGAFSLAKPLSRKCFVKYGGDLLLLLEDGLYPISLAMQSTSIDRNIAVSNKIFNAWQTAVSSFRGEYGWSIYSYWNGPFVLVNVPGASAASSQQFIMNTKTRAWARFVGMGGVDWAIVGGQLFFCLGPDVYQAWVGPNDSGRTIVMDGQSGYSHFGYGSQLKQWTMLRPVMRFSAAAEIKVGLNVDFTEYPLSATARSTVEGASTWGSSLWGVGLWSVDSFIKQDWLTMAAPPGYYASTKVKLETSTAAVQWYVTNYIMQTGGLL